MQDPARMLCRIPYMVIYTNGDFLKLFHFRQQEMKIIRIYFIFPFSMVNECGGNE
jgi:hypothetical protein